MFAFFLNYSYFKNNNFLTPSILSRVVIYTMQFYLKIKFQIKVSLCCLDNTPYILMMTKLIYKFRGWSFIIIPSAYWWLSIKSAFLVIFPTNGILNILRLLYFSLWPLYYMSYILNIYLNILMRLLFKLQSNLLEF